MPRPLPILLGKAVRKIARLRGGNGSALPGLFVEKIDPDFIKRTLGTLPHGVVLVSGTNGKTTTTKMVVELLEGQGLRVFTNKTGSNFTRGVAAALLGEITLSGTLAADIAVLELDEAHATHFVKAVAPTYSLLLNVMRDQLDRFGEIDATARLLQTIASHTTTGVVLNREDPRVRSIAEHLESQHVSYFGLDPFLYELFPDDDNLHAQAHSPKPHSNLEADVVLQSISDTTATFVIDNASTETSLQLRGVYNIYNAAAALATVRLVLGATVDTHSLITTLRTIQPAFGRGETIIVGGQPVELVLVKNPSGFRLGLSSFNPETYATMVAINDNYADGRDMSWLWDVDFSSLQPSGVHVVSGVRAYDMSLRLSYDNVPVQQTIPDLKHALRTLISTNPDTPKRIYATYTAMLALRRELGKITTVEAIDR